MKTVLRSFPDASPASFPIAVAKGSASVTLYKTVSKGLLEFKIPFAVDGKRKFHRFSTYEEARDKGREMLSQFASGNADAVILTNEDKTVYLRAKTALPDGVALDTAAMNYAAHLREAGSEAALREAVKEYIARHRSIEKKSVADAVKEMIAAKTARTKKGKPASADYVRDLNSRLGNFADSFKCDLAGVQPADVLAYLDGLNLSGRSYFNLARMIRTFFKFAQSRKWYPQGVNAMEGIEIGFVDDGAIEIFTPKELATMLATARPELVPFLAIGALAGLRSKEIERLDWSKVNLADRHIVVEAQNAKTASRRIVPIVDNLALWLAPYHKDAGAVVEFANVPKQIAWLEDDIQATEPGFKWKHNGLRHSFISYRCAATKNVNQTAMDAGNSPAMIHKHYREVVTEKDAAAWFSVTPGAATNILPMTKTA